MTIMSYNIVVFILNCLVIVLKFWSWSQFSKTYSNKHLLHTTIYYINNTVFLKMKLKRKKCLHILPLFTVFKP